MAQLYYNGYPFLPNSVWFRISKRPVLSKTNRRAFVEEMWFINGRVQGTNSSEVIAAADALASALDDRGDLVFSLYHQLLDADCLDGTHIRDFQWLSGYDGVRGSGAELVLRRTFQLVISGTRLATSDTDIFELREEVSGFGTGLPHTEAAMSLGGYPQPQQTAAHTIFTAHQRGMAIGLTAAPSASTPIWIATPNVYYDQESLGGAISTPIRWGVNQNTLYKTTWSYRCWSPSVALVASPVGF